MRCTGGEDEKEVDVEVEVEPEAEFRKASFNRTSDNASSRAFWSSVRRIKRNKLKEPKEKVNAR